MKRINLRLAEPRRAQSLIVFTLLIVAFFGFLALVLDLGFLFGQRRYDQNGADAGALAVAQTIAGNISPNAGGAAIDVSDSVIYGLARQYAGLPATGAVPNGVNQNANLDTSNRLAVMVEYYNGDPNGTWCFSQAAMAALPSPPLPAPRPSPAVESTCATNQRTVNSQTFNFPPDPDIASGAGAYKIRVTISSVTTGNFAQVLGGQAGQIGPSVGTAGINDLACSRPGNGSGTAYNGMLTCAQAVAVISGVPNASVGAPVVPVSADYCVVGNNQGIYALWTSNVPTCPQAPWNQPNQVGNWKGYVDLGSETQWCADGYTYVDYFPQSGIDGQIYSAYNATCSTPYSPSWPLANNDWIRKNYKPPKAYQGSDQAKTDVPYWASTGFDGTIWAAAANNPAAAGGPGQFVPTYCGQSGFCGDGGQNLAQGFYCMKGQVFVTANGMRDGCSTSVNASGTFFFRQSQLTANCPTNPNMFGDPNLRCTIAGVPEWLTPQTESPSGGWVQEKNGSPDRVQIVQIAGFRLFCDLDSNGDCTLPPSSVVSPANASSVYGYFVSTVAPQPCNPCNTPVTFTVNATGLSQ